MNIDPLTELTIALSKPDIGETEKLSLICHAVSGVLRDADRVSLWRFNSELTEMQCIFLLADNQVIESGNLCHSREQYPDYFAAVLRNDTVNATHARTHPDTMCFTDDYFVKHNIYSLLDYVFRRDFAPFGVICCEATEAPVSWKERDVALLKRVASIVSMFY